MSPPIRPFLERYGLALLAVAAALLVKLAGAPLVDLDAPFVLFLAATMISAWYGGLGPGLVATALAGLLTDYFFLAPRYALAPLDSQGKLRLGVFLLEGTLISVLAAKGQRLWQQACEQRDWLGTVLDTIGDGVVALDGQGRVTYLNPVARRLTGWDLREARGLPAGDVVRLADAHSRAPLANTEADGQVRTCLLVARDGTSTFVDHRAMPLRANRNGLGGMLRVFRDQSEQRQRQRSEEVLRESEVRFRALADAAPVMIWMADAAKRAEYFNQPWYDFTGRDPGQVNGDAWVEGIHPDDRPRCQEALNTAYAVRNDFEVEYRLRRRDGVYRHVLDRATPRRSPDGQFLGFIGSCIDITDRKRAEQSLRQSEARFRQLADAMPQIVWSTGSAGRVDYYNRRWADFTRLSPEQTFAVDGWWHLVLHPDEVENCAEAWREAVRAQRPFQIECRLRDGTGEGYRWFLARAVPVRDEYGEVVRWYGTCTDIHDQKLVEETSKESNRSKDEFLAMLSHELRGPLAPVLNSLQILQLDEHADPAQAAARDVIERQVRHLAGIVDDLLDVFLLVHRKVALNRETLDLAGLTRRAAEEYRPAAEAAGLRLDLELPPEPVWVFGDQSRLGQVLDHLLQNALKFTNPGDRVIVDVAADAEHQRVSVRVRDSGIGLTPEVQQELFEMFAQARQNLARRLGGLGLGLAIVKGVVELHGGKVRAASAGPGAGSEFSFTMPLGRAPSAAPQVVPHSAPAAGRSLRLLIVEDNEDTAETLRRLLERFGHDARMAHTGTAGVKVARDWRPDVVLCDLGLPEMDGYEVASTLRRDPAMASARLIAISGYGQEEDRRRSEEAGFDLHMTKPVDPMQLKRLLTVIKVGH